MNLFCGLYYGKVVKWVVLLVIVLIGSWLLSHSFMCVHMGFFQVLQFLSTCLRTCWLEDWQVCVRAHGVQSKVYSRPDIIIIADDVWNFVL